MKKFLCMLTILAASASGVAVGQESVSVNNGLKVINPLVKRFGTNIPASVNVNNLNAQQAALKALNLRYVRLSTGWGLEGNGLYTGSQVSGTNIDFSQIDPIVNLLSGDGIQIQFVTGVPAGYNVANAKADSINWQTLYQNFAAHYFGKLSNPAYEVLSNIKDLYFPYDGNSDTYPGIGNYVTAYRAAANGIIAGGSSATINPLIFAGSVSGEYAYGTGNAEGLRQYLKGDHGTSRCDGLSAEIIGNEFNGDNSQWKRAIYDGGGFREQGQDWTFTWESIISDYRASKATDGASVDYTSVPDFLAKAKDLLNFSDVTRVYVSQLIDGEDGTKGLISADGTKSALYYGLQLYNEMPSDRDSVTVNGQLQALASSDETTSAAVVWNPTSSEITTNISLSDIPFSTGDVTLYAIDANNSNNGTESVKSLGTLSGNNFTTSVTIPANGTVFLFAKNTEPVSSYEPISGIKAVHQNWWFKYTEGWARGYIDPLTASAWVGESPFVPVNQGGDTGDWGSHNEAIDVANTDLNAKLLVKVVKSGDGKPQIKDNNSAIYVRIDYEAGFVDEEDPSQSLLYYANPWIYVDPNNGIYDATHGSMPDSYPNGNVREEGNTEVNFLAPEGFTINLADHAPDDGSWTGNYRIIAYIQNPGVHNSNGVQYKFQFLDPTKPITITNGIENVKTTTAVESLNNAGVYDISGRYVGKNAKNLPAGIYILKAGNTTKKIIKR